MKEYDYEKMSTEGFSCECEVAGYCPLLDKAMSPHLHNLCQTNEVYRNRFLENAKKKGVHHSSVSRQYNEDTQKTLDLTKSADSAIQELKSEGINLNEEIESKGLGDTIQKVLSKFGITSEKVERIAGMKGCGCSERKQWFNKIFSYNKDDKDVK